MRNVYWPIRLCLSLQLFAVVVVAQEQQFANIGDLKLQNDGVIRNCRVGYRTFGKLAADKSNVIVFPTWASGTTEQLKGSIGPGKLIDSLPHCLARSCSTWMATAVTSPPPAKPNASVKLSVIF
jgi:homoserine O-acetyltransferase